MIYAMWFVLLLASFVVDVLGLFVVPFAIWRSDGNTLPAWARWWDNDREPLGDTARGGAIDAASGWRRGVLRWHWLCIRNPGNNFGYALGFIQSPDVVYLSVGDTDTSDQGHPGRLFVRAYRDDALCAFCFYYVKRWGTSGRCLRVMLGWKIHDMVNDGNSAQIVGVINPFMTFRGLNNA